MKIYKSDGIIEALVEIEGDFAELLTKTNTFQWSGMMMTPDLAEITIKVLEEYIECINNKTNNYE